MKVEIFYMGKAEGYIEYPSATFGYSDAEKCFDMCNWSHWSEEKPKELHSEIVSTQHGICFRTEDGTNYLALTNGWLMGDDAKIAAYIEKNKERMLWI